ncbi:MAG: hypothetical protein ABUL62_25970 [Myxococcales bacterium]
MPFTVTCPACSSRFTLGDDLYKRKVVGNLVTVKCRHCSAEIAVDATVPPTLPSQDAPRRAPSPPRPKLASVTRMGLGPAPASAALVGQSATATPLGQNLTGTPLPFNATATPFPQGATATPRARAGAPKPATPEPVSIWDDSDETVQINAPKLPPAPGPKPTAALHLPRVPHPPRKVREEEPELIEAEEIPASSSDAPTLDTLKLEGVHANQPGKRAPDDFLVSLSAGTQGILGAPTIDVSNLGAPDAEPPPSIDRIDLDLDIVEAEEIEFHQPNRGPRSGTMPLFDMSAVLPAASDGLKSAASPAVSAKVQASDAPASVSVPAPESKARERKFVVAPQSEAAVAPNATGPKAKRAGAAVWFGLVAVAAGVVAIVGLRGHGPAAHVATEPTAEPSAPPAPVEPAKVAAAEPPAQDSTASAALSASASEPSVAPPPPAPSTTSIPTAVNAPITANGSANLKPEPALNTEKPVATAAPPATPEQPALEKPAVASKPVEVQNAPPPAADGTEFDRAAARNALASAAAQASACRKDGDPSGTATITITFAPSGRITTANLQGPPFAGTATGGCIANAMRRATVPAFSGERVTVTKQIVVE